MNFYHMGVIAALIGFAIASFLYLQSFASTPSRIHRIAYAFFLFSTFLMTTNTINVLRYHIEHLVTPFILISAICWITVFAIIIFDFRMLGGIISLISMLILLVQFLFVPPHDQTMGEGPSVLIYTHIITSLLGEAFAIVAFVIAVLYLMQQRAMKAKQISRLSLAQVPISKLNQALALTVWTGFILMSIGLIIGAIYTQFYIVGDRNALTGKIIWAFLVWIWYLAILVCRNLLNVSAKKLAWMTIFGFGIMATGMFGVNYWSNLLD